RQRCEGSDEIATDRVRVADAARPELTGQNSLDHHAHLTRRDGAHLEAGLLEREAYGPASLEPVQLGLALERLADVGERARYGHAEPPAAARGWLTQSRSHGGGRKQSTLQALFTSPSPPTARENPALCSGFWPSCTTTPAVITIARKHADASDHKRKRFETDASISPSRSWRREVR